MVKGRFERSDSVAQLAERGFVPSDTENMNNENKSPRWDLNPRPKVFAPAGYINIIPPSGGLRNLRREKKAIQLP
jgi:hypothetical protein